MIFRAHPFNYRYADAREMIAEIGALLDADRAKSGRRAPVGSRGRAGR